MPIVFNNYLSDACVFSKWMCSNNSDNNKQCLSVMNSTKRMRNRWSESEKYTNTHTQTNEWNKREKMGGVNFTWKFIIVVQMATNRWLNRWNNGRNKEVEIKRNNSNGNGSRNDNSNWINWINSSSQREISTIFLWNDDGERQCLNKTCF